MKLPWYMKERKNDGSGNTEIYITRFGRICLFFKVIIWDALRDFSFVIDNDNRTEH